MGSPWIRPRSLFSQIVHGRIVRWTLWMYLSNLKFVALALPEIIGVLKIICAVPGYAYAPFSPKFVMGFCRMDLMNAPAKFKVRSFTRSWNNRGYSKNLGSPWIRPRFLFSEIFHELLFGWTPLWIYRPNLPSVALPVPEIIAIAILGWCCQPPILGKGRPHEVGDGTVRKRVGEFL